MGGNTYSGEKTAERSVSEKFITWFNGVEFKDDNEMAQALTEIKAECNVRLEAIAEEE